MTNLALVAPQSVMPDVVLSYEHAGLINRIQEKEGMSEANARSLYVDMLRFLYICGTRDERFGPPDGIDTAWHHFILFTRDYADFCQHFFGKFIHHSPTNGDVTPEGELTTIQRTLLVAHEIFGELSSNWDYAKKDALSCAKCDTPSTNCQNK